MRWFNRLVYLLVGMFYFLEFSIMRAVGYLSYVVSTNFHRLGFRTQTRLVTGTLVFSVALFFSKLVLIVDAGRASFTDVILLILLGFTAGESGNLRNALEEKKRTWRYHAVAGRQLEASDVLEKLRSTRRTTLNVEHVSLLLSLACYDGRNFLDHCTGHLEELISLKEEGMVGFCFDLHDPVLHSSSRTLVQVTDRFWEVVDDLMPKGWWVNPITQVKTATA